MTEQDQGKEAAELIALAYSPADRVVRVAARLRERDAKIERLKRGYTADGFESFPCPGCTWDKGKLVARCALHNQIAEANDRLADVCAQLAEANKDCDALSGLLDRHGTRADKLEAELAAAIEERDKWKVPAEISKKLAEQLIEDNAQLRIQLDAWHKTFGTTQLTHALARLEQAEKERDAARVAGMQEAMKIMSTAHFDYCKKANRYPSHDLVEYQKKAIADAIAAKENEKA